MNKIVILNYHMAMGGTEKALIALLNSIDYSQNNVVLYLVHKTGSLLNEIPKQVNVKVLKFKKEKYRYFSSGNLINKGWKTLFWKVLRKIFKAINRVKYEDGSLFELCLNEVEVDEKNVDILCDFSGYGGFTTAVGAKKIKAKKKFTWIHSDRCEWLKNVYNYLDYYDKLFCVSKTVKNIIDRKFNDFSCKTEVFYNIISAQEIMEKSEEKCEKLEGNNILVTVGRITYQKGWDVALLVAKELKSRNYPFKWYFVGRGEDYDKMKKQIKKLNLTNEVVMLGEKNNPYPYIAQCDYYIQPSRYEGYGITVLEAKVLKRIIIASELPGIKEQIENRKNGLLVSLNVKEISDIICEISNNDSLKKQIVNELNMEHIDFSSEINKLYY